MQWKVGEQGRLISPCLKAGALRHILVSAVSASIERRWALATLAIMLR